MADEIFFPPDIEFALIHFHLEFRELFDFNISLVPGLRGELLSVARHSPGRLDNHRMRDLFDPPLPTDPVALRRYQKPGPSFVILPDPRRHGILQRGDHFEITVSFWGRGIQMLSDFSALLQELGRTGFHQGQGLFDLVAMEAEDSSGTRSPVWRRGERLHLIAPPVNELSWWLHGHHPPESLSLEFLTPARLLSQGRPLFRVDFRRLFPFILRRVTSMVYAHCDRDLIEDPLPLLAAAGQVNVEENKLGWKDWRFLETPSRMLDFGGIGGSIRLSGDHLGLVFKILRVGTLMNLGKGAAFGAGRYRLGE